MSVEVFPAGHFKGATTSWEVADVILSEVRHAHARHVSLHAHEAAYFSLLLEGAYSERGEGFDLVYEPYTFVFHATRTPHQDDIGEAGARFFAIALGEKWDRVIDELGGARSHVFELDGGEAAWLSLRLYREFVARESASAAEVESLVYELCTHVALTADDTVEPPWMAEIDAVVRERFREPLDLGSIAKSAGVHPAHLCRTYRHFRKRTLSDAIGGMRIQLVCRRLVESDDSLTAIALETGFTDQSHMSNAFKRVTGQAPGAHRKGERAKLLQDP